MGRDHPGLDPERAILLASGVLMEWLGQRALRALVRLSGMLLIMMAVQMLMDGVAIYIEGVVTSF